MCDCYYVLMQYLFMLIRALDYKLSKRIRCSLSIVYSGKKDLVAPSDVKITAPNKHSGLSSLTGLLLYATYQEKVISAGFSARGSSKWLADTQLMGRIATKSVIFQSCGTNGARARMIMPAMMIEAKIMENLN